MIKKLSMIAAILLLMNMNVGIAGTTCKKADFDPHIYSEASGQALKLNDQLNRLNAKVVLISRVGADLSKYGIHYSHIAFAVKHFSGRENKWTVIHLLNHCGTTYSSIYAQGLMNFFMDDLYKMDYQITVLNPVLQQKLHHALKTSLIRKIHNRRYSMLAYPFSSNYQNSNQWVLELIEAVESNSDSQKMSQKKLMEKNYRPSVIDLDGLSVMGASLFDSNIKFDDHPQHEQNDHHYSVVTVDSIIQYLKQQRNIMNVIDMRQ